MTNFKYLFSDLSKKSFNGGEFSSKSSFHQFKVKFRNSDTTSVWLK